MSLNDSTTKNRSNSATKRSRSPFSRFLSIIDAYLMGYDVFVSYSWKDGRAYAEDLVKRLKSHKYRCFLDSVEYKVGDDLDKDASRAVGCSRAMAVIVSPSALKSKHVRKEIRIFDEKEGPLVPIDIKETLYTKTTSNGNVTYQRSTTASEYIDEISEPEREEVEHTLDLLSRDRKLQIEEPNCRSASNETIEKLVERFNFSRRVARRLRVITAACILLVLLMSASVYWLIESNSQRNLAQKNAEEADKQRGIAELNAKDADKQRGIAELNADDAKEQQKVAEENARDAEQQRKVADEERRIAQRETQRAVKSEKETAGSLARADRTLALQSIQQGQYPEAFAFLKRSLENDPSNLESAQMAWSLINRQNLVFPRGFLPLRQESTASIFSRDGRQLLRVARNGRVSIYEFAMEEEIFYGILEGIRDTPPGVWLHLHSDPIEGTITFGDPVDEGRVEIRLDSPDKIASKTARLWDKIDRIDPAYSSLVATARVVEAYNEETGQKILGFPSSISARLKARFSSAKHAEQLILRVQGVARWEDTHILLPDGKVLELSGFPAFAYQYLEDSGCLLVERSTYYGDEVIEAVFLNEDSPRRLRLAYAPAGSHLSICIAPDGRHIIINRDASSYFLAITDLADAYSEFPPDSREDVDLTQFSRNVIQAVNPPRSIFVSADRSELVTDEGDAIRRYSLQRDGFMPTIRVEQGNGEEDKEVFGNPTMTCRLVVDTPYEGKTMITPLSPNRHRLESSQLAIGAVALSPPSVMYEDLPNPISDDGSYALVFPEGSYQHASPVYRLDLESMELMPLEAGVSGSLLWQSPADHWALLFVRAPKGQFQLVLVSGLDAEIKRAVLPLDQLTAVPQVYETHEAIVAITPRASIRIPKTEPHQIEVLDAEDHERMQALLSGATTVDGVPNYPRDRIPLQLIAPALRAAGLSKEVGQRDYQIIKRGPTHLVFCDMDSEWRARTPFSRMVVLSQDCLRVLDSGLPGWFTYLSEDGTSAVTFDGSYEATWWSPCPRENDPPNWIADFLQAYSGCFFDSEDKLSRQESTLSKGPDGDVLVRSWDQVAAVSGFVPQEKAAK